MLLKVRDLGKTGVITDISGFGLPPEAFTFAKNVRFNNGRVERGPVWRTGSSIGTFESGTDDPRFVCNHITAPDQTSIFLGYKGGIITKWVNGSETDVSISGYSASDSEAPWTHADLAQVKYVNREDRVPWYIGPTDLQFSAIPDWDSKDRAKIIRTYNNAVIALNITKDGVRYPTLVKTSDIIADSGQPPGDWDHTDPENNATENILSEMTGEITDACLLGDSLMIYGLNQTFRMRADGSAQVYRYDRLPFAKGSINVNCSVEVDGVNYVFGPDDIWMHDGTTPVSIADKRVRQFVYRTMNRSMFTRFFVHHDLVRKEILFFYVSGDQYVAFDGTLGCNRVAVFNYMNGTWTFDDAPNVFAGAYGNVSGTETWETTVGDWDSSGGSWLDLEDGLKGGSIFVGDAHSDSNLGRKLYALDQWGEGSIISAPAESAPNPGAYLVRTGIDLDEIDANLRGYKHVIHLYPQGLVGTDGQPVQMRYGVQDYANQQPTYSNFQTFDGNELYKIDFTAGGRYLSYEIRYDDFRTMSLTGFDVEVEITGDQ